MTLPLHISSKLHLANDPTHANLSQDFVCRVAVGDFLIIGATVAITLTLVCSGLMLWGQYVGKP